MKSLLSLLLTLITLTASAQQKPALIPQPENIAWADGSFTIDKKTTISTASATLRPAADYLSEILTKITGITPKQKKRGGTIRLSISEDIAVGGYMLTITPNLITIAGGDYQGVANGISTLRQLAPPSSVLLHPSSISIPCCKILDRPRFDWRGMELDCSRHFFTKEEVMELLDVLAQYKVNKLHWHLTDDQGWRIEIKKYPLLTEHSAWRVPNDQDTACVNIAMRTDNPDMQLPHSSFKSQPSNVNLPPSSLQVYGGYYTQDDIREIVSYAQQRGIDIVPEIDIPGHSLCAIVNYKGLSCTEHTGWGQFFTTPLCPGKDRVLEFCKDVYSEVFDLFPYHYVHLGGDEVDMSHWKRCPDCQSRMKQLKLKSEAELQAWFLHQMEEFCNAHGRDIIGWDEIIAGGLSATSTVMWWRSWNKAALEDGTRHGNHVICTPNSQFYLDYEAGNDGISNIYNFDPTPASLNDQQKKLVLGVQGNLWTEYVPSRERMFYMAFPRMLAVAELGWSQEQNRNYDDFLHRLVPHYERLRQQGVTYRQPDIEGFFESNVFTTDATINLTCHDPSAVIRYTTDGSIPQTISTLYTGPFTISHDTDFAFRLFGPDGRKGQTVRCTYRKEDYAEAVSIAHPAAPEEATIDMKSNVSPSGDNRGAYSGLCCEWYDYRGPRCADIDQAPLIGTFTTDGVLIPDSCKGNIGLIFNGFIEIPADGIYTFRLLSDDGSYLMLDGKIVVDNDGEHSPKEVVGQHAMRRGLHPLTARYFDHNGGTLRLQVLDQLGRQISVSYRH